MQCCGTPFGIGDTVEWPVTVWGGRKLYGCDKKIDYMYEAHSDKYAHLLTLQGTVQQIDSMYQQFRRMEDKGYVLVPDSGFVRPTAKADGWDENEGDARFTGYIVVLEKSAIRLAEQSEITFR